MYPVWFTLYHYSPDSNWLPLSICYILMICENMVSLWWQCECVCECCVCKWSSPYMYNHYVGEGYDIASLLCPIPFHVRRNKIYLNQLYICENNITLHKVVQFPWLMGHIFQERCTNAHAILSLSCLMTPGRHLVLCMTILFYFSMYMYICLQITKANITLQVFDGHSTWWLQQPP